ncbi:hypothetical protein MLD38_037958 [Melastoma candidum]|uniref:Uncharacterized protein n=1 Tax=Melastoma candidum TaxID=119954 RepID=A0ACB9KXR5_9MYRT|nr:hypothetical protein MLD38_037958 [Melastoma candidum]
MLQRKVGSGKAPATFLCAFGFGGEKSWGWRHAEELVWRVLCRVRRGANPRLCSPRKRSLHCDFVGLRGRQHLSSPFVRPLSKEA